MNKELFFHVEGTDISSFFLKSLTLRWFDEIAAAYQVKLGAISFIFCNDDYILNINRQYLQHDYYTDVITFDYTENKYISGDIFISVDTVSSNAKQYKTDVEEEFHRVMCHALLHLIGFKDKTPEDEEIMRRNEDRCLNMLKMLKK